MAAPGCHTQLYRTQDPRPAPGWSCKQLLQVFLQDHRSGTPDMKITDECLFMNTAVSVITQHHTPIPSQRCSENLSTAKETLFLLSLFASILETARKHCLHNMNISLSFQKFFIQIPVYFPSNTIRWIQTSAMFHSGGATPLATAHMVGVKPAALRPQLSISQATVKLRLVETPETLPLR